MFHNACYALTYADKSYQFGNTFKNTLGVNFFHKCNFENLLRNILTCDGHILHGNHVPQ